MLFSIWRSTCRCVSRLVPRLEYDQKANELSDEEPLQSRTLETLLIPGADPGCCFDLSPEAAHKLQGEGASPEDQRAECEVTFPGFKFVEGSTKTPDIQKQVDIPIFKIFFISSCKRDKNHSLGKSGLFLLLIPTLFEKQKQKAFMTPHLENNSLYL